jgi:nucleoside-diphosphate-sugar epimerase
MRVLIVGCGYVGLPLGQKLAWQGHAVFGVRREDDAREELAAAGIVPLTADVTKPAELARLPGPFDWVVNCVSSTRGGAAVYRQVYLEGTRNVLQWLAGSGLQKYVHTGSTSVYAQTDGARVDESSPPEPASETSRILLETEQLLIEAARARNFPAVILRVAGIYGPGRGHLFQQYLRDEARLQGDGQRLLNMIHRDDAATAIIAALEHGKTGEIYNVADDESVTQLDFFRWLSEALGKPMPPTVEAENAAAGDRNTRLTAKATGRRFNGWARAETEIRNPDFAAKAAIESIKSHE